MTDTLTEIRDQNLTGDVDVDGKHFVNCRFAKVELRYGGGELPVFENCEIDEMSWFFHGAALRTIQLIRAQNQNGAAQEMIDIMFKWGVIERE